MLVVPVYLLSSSASSAATWDKLSCAFKLLTNRLPHVVGPSSLAAADTKLKLIRRAYVAAITLPYFAKC